MFGNDSGPRESRTSLRIRWSSPPDKQDVNAYVQSLSPKPVNRPDLSVYGRTACVTATFEDEKSRNDALTLARAAFPGATVDTIFEHITVWKTAEQPDLDICAVHGLAGSAADSFTVQNTIWLRDLLPNEPSFASARISTFGYTSKFFDESSSDGLHDWAGYLLEGISYLRMSTRTIHLPIIFIGHSMGGLVVRHALEHLFQYPSDQKHAGVTLRKCAALFIATPHDGSTVVEYSDLLMGILSSFGLKRDLFANHLSSLSDSAARSKQMWERMDQLKCTPPVECLTESRATKIHRFRSAVVVKQSSAGIAGKFANKVPDTDHMQVCKFKDAFAPGYGMVVTRLQALQHALDDKTRKRTLVSPIATRFDPIPSSHGIKRKFTELELTTNQLNHHWIVARPLNALFTGRAEIIKSVEEALIASAKAKDITVQRRFWGIFWVDVSSSTSAESAYIQISKTVGNHADSLEEACQAIANLQKSWMLILDNADDPYFDYTRYFPSGDQGIVLVTSRNNECSQYATVGTLTLPGLSTNDARKLLLKTIKIPTEKISLHEADADEVAELLGYHPLALLQAGAYVARSHTTLSEYPKVFADHRQRLLHYLPTQARSRYGDVYATFEASARLLEQSDDQNAKDALELLSMLSVMACKPVPLSLFRAAWEVAFTVQDGDLKSASLDQLSSWHVDRMMALAKPEKEAWDSFRLFEACYLLQSLSLLSVDKGSSSSGLLTMHPLTHAWARDRQPKALQDGLWTKTSATVALALKKKDRWIHLEQLMKPHLHTLLEEHLDELYGCGPQTEITRLLYTFGATLCLMRDEYNVLSLVERLVHKLGIEDDKVSSDLLPLYDLIGITFVRTNQAEKAIKVLEQVVTIRKDQAEHGALLLQSKHELAKAYRNGGYLDKAAELLEEVIEKRSALPENDVELLRARLDLATTFASQLKPYEDAAVVQKAIELQGAMTDGDADQLFTPTGLVPTETISESINKATGILQHVLQILERDRAKDDPTVLSTQHVLACVYRQSGKLTDAIALFEQIKENLQGRSEDHPERLSSLGELAKTYFMAEEFAKTIELAEHILKVRILSHQQDRRNLWRIQGLLAVAYEANGETDKAFGHMQRVMAIRQSLENADPLELVQMERLLRSWMRKVATKRDVLFEALSSSSSSSSPALPSLPLPKDRNEEGSS